MKLHLHTAISLCCHVLLVILSSPVHSFSAWTSPPSSTTIASPNSRNQQCRRLEESFAEWTDAHAAYLRKHQVTHYRKAAGRAWNLFRQVVGSGCGNDCLVWTTLLPFSQFRNTTTLTAVAQHMVQTLPRLGPTYVKVGQALATRPDLLPSAVVDDDGGGVGQGLANALLQLHDDVPPFSDRVAKAVIRRECLRQMRYYNKRQQQKKDSFSRATSMTHPYFGNNVTALDGFLDSLSDQPVAAASMAQVYSGYLSGFGRVAVKVQRPGIRRRTERDATLFHTLAATVQGRKDRITANPWLGKMNIVRTVDEFTARVLEDMDFERERHNMQTFFDLYDNRKAERHDRGGVGGDAILPSHRANLPVVVPKVVPELCTDRLIVMEWLEGTKLTDLSSLTTSDSKGDSSVRAHEERSENLQLVEKTIQCTLVQLMDTGVLHADPHTGNLLKLKNGAHGEVQLGYLDFGLVNVVPPQFRDAIVCAVVQVVFARNLHAVVDLLVDVGLVSRSTLYNHEERKRLMAALQYALDSIVLWPTDRKGRATAIPQIRFQNLLPCLAVLVANFDITVPPYFLNNIRALATLEGIALRLDPEFNILRVIYPFSINHLMRNPQVSHKAQDTFLDICRNPQTRLVDWRKFRLLLNDWSIFTGHKKRRIFWDLMSSTGGRHVTFRIVQEWFLKRIRLGKRLLGHIASWDLPRWDVFWVSASSAPVYQSI